MLANGVVVLPDHLPDGTPRAVQDRVQRAVAAVFPARQLCWIDAIAANWLGGGAQCATLSEPALAG